MLTSGMYGLGPDRGRLLVKTTRSGLGRRAGHDLTIEATRWSGTARVEPEDLSACSVAVEIEVAGLEVREGTGGVLPLGDSDRLDIVKSLRKILQADRYPVITFRSTAVSGEPADFKVEGELTISGTARPAVLQGRLEDDRITGRAVVVQSRWGIKPYSALLGALRLADEVEIVVDVALTPTPDA